MSTSVIESSLSWYIHTARDGTGTYTENGTSTIGNNGSWSLTLLWTSVKISIWCYTFYLVPVPVLVPVSINVNNGLFTLLRTGNRTGNGKRWVSVLPYVLYTLHRDSKSLFSIVSIPVPVPFPFPVPCSVWAISHKCRLQWLSFSQRIVRSGVRTDRRTFALPWVIIFPRIYRISPPRYLYSNELSGQVIYITHGNVRCYLTKQRRRAPPLPLYYTLTASTAFVISWLTR